jgi:hypothetical protein
MNQMPWLGFFPVLLFALPMLAWYVGTFVLLLLIWRELKAIRLKQ